MDIRLCKRTPNSDAQIEETETETVVFIPHTPGSVLKTRIAKIEEELQFRGRVKYVEELVTTMGELLGRPDPWGGHCGRLSCFPCRTQEGKCHSQGVVYEITCMICKGEGIESQYYRESARNGHDRGLEHLAALRNESTSSSLVTHWKEFHKEQEIFNININ